MKENEGNFIIVCQFYTEPSNLLRRVPLIFKIENKSSLDFEILKWNTPLEGLKSDCIIVKDEAGKAIPYDGFLFKRANPKESNYELLRRGEFLSKEIDLSEAYKLETGKKYYVHFNPENMDFKPVKRLLKDFYLNAIPKIVTLTSLVEVKESRSQTKGEKCRELTLMKFSYEITGTDPREPVIKGADPIQKKIILAAHKNGFKCTVTAIKNIKNDSKYLKWFGEATESRMKIVKSVYQKIEKRMRTTEFTYQLNGRECDEETYAYTVEGGTTVWLCQLFLDAEDKGPASKAGTIVHEHSHASAGTGDLKYSEDKCMQLARTSPEGAIKNADNYEFYAEYFSLRMRINKFLQFLKKKVSFKFSR